MHTGRGVRFFKQKANSFSRNSTDKHRSKRHGALGALAGGERRGGKWAELCRALLPDPQHSGLTCGIHYGSVVFVLICGPLIRFYRVCLICLTQLFNSGQYPCQVQSPALRDSTRAGCGWTMTSGRGGLHTVFCVTEEVLSAAPAALHHLDLRSGGELTHHRAFLKN